MSWKAVSAIALLLLLAAAGSVAADLVLPLWRDDPALDGGDGGKYAALLRDFEEVARLYESKDPTARTAALVAWEECSDLLEKHGDWSDPAAESLRRMSFWLALTAGEYQKATDIASELYARTGEGAYLGWKALALFKLGRRFGFTLSDAARAPSGVLEAAALALSAGMAAEAADAATKVRLCEPCGSDAELAAAGPAVEALARQGRGFAWRSIVRLTLEDFPQERRAAVLDGLLSRAGATEERDLWLRLVIEGETLSPARDDFHQRARELVFACEAGLPSYADCAAVARRLAEWGEKDLLARFAADCTRARKSTLGLVTALVEKGLVTAASAALEDVLSRVSAGESALICRQVAASARRKGVSLLALTAGAKLGPLETAWFAFERNDEAALEEAVRRLRNRDMNAWAFLVVSAFALKRGTPLSVSLETLDALCSKAELERGWLFNFRYPEIAAAALAATDGEPAELVALVERCAERLSGGDPAAAALAFDAVAGGDPRFASAAVRRLIASARNGESPPSVAESLCLRFSLWGSAPVELLVSAADAFPRHGTLQLLAGKALAAAGRKKEALARLKEAFVFGEGYVRTEAESLIRELENRKRPSNKGEER